MTSKYICKTCKHHQINPNDDEWCDIINDWLDCIELDFIERVGCTSHSDFNKPKKAHDVEKFSKEERIPKYKDTIFEETEDGGAVIGYLTESPSGCPRPTIATLNKKQYNDYKKHKVNYGD